MFDDLNTDYVKILGQGWMRPNPAGLGGTVGDEYTFTKRSWIPHKRTCKFGSVDGTTGHNQHDVYFFLMCYDG